jgi:hypothetical protein
LAVASTQAKIAVGQHDQGDMAMETRPQPSFVVIEPQFPLGVLIEALYDPTAVGQLHQTLQVQVIEAPSEVVLGFTLVAQQGTFAHKPPLGNGVAASIATPIDPHAAGLFDQCSRGALPPGDGMPGVLGQAVQQVAGGVARYSVFQTPGPPWSSLALVGRGLFGTRVLVHLLRPAEPHGSGDTNQVGQLPTLQSVQERGLVSIACIGYYRTGWHSSLQPHVDQLQSYLPFGAKRHLCRHLGSLSALSVVVPGLRKVNPARDRPVEDAVHVVGSYQHLAVVHSAQGARVLAGHAHRPATFLR